MGGVGVEVGEVAFAVGVLGGDVGDHRRPGPPRCGSVAGSMARPVARSAPGSVAGSMAGWVAGWVVRR